MTPCRFFRTPAGCSRGQSCTFSHETLLVGEAPRHDSSQARPPRDELHQWIYQIPRPQGPNRPLTRQLPAFFKIALQLVDKDAGSRQEVVTKLASDGGLQRINEVIEAIQEPRNTSLAARRTVFRDLLLPIFEILSRDQVKSSFVLESALHTLFNYLFGLAGRRATTVFNLTVNVLPDVLKSQATAMNVFHAAVSVFGDVVAVNGTASVNPDLQAIAEALNQCYARIDQNIVDSILYYQAGNLLKTIARRFGHSNKLPELKPVDTVVTKAQFHIERDLPGSLSHLGPRHDNDFEDFRKIRLLPTASEVHSQRSEYLPTTNVFEQHLPGVQGLLDRHFRLLREDTVGQLRDAVSFEYERSRGLHADEKPQQQARTFTYHNATLYSFNYHKSRGFDLIYDFEQPKAAAALASAKARRDWWQGSRRLQAGALVCLLDTSGNPIYCQVSSVGLPDADNHSRPVKDVPSWCNVFDDKDRAHVLLSLVDIDETNLNLILDGYINGHGRGVETIIEFPGILLPSFRPTLQALQAMSTAGEMPFAQILAPELANTAEYQVIPPPAYTAGKFRFNLTSLTGEDSTLSLATSEEFDTSDLQRQSMLDSAQAEALVSALTRRVALIQGPPGTGKSYTGVALIKVLLENQTKAKLGPIICVCYTNHALDQLLMHLVNHGVDQIIRVGSRSKENALQEVNLRGIAQQLELTKTEKRQQWEAHKRIEEHLKTLNQLAGDFEKAQSVEQVRLFLESQYPERAVELFARDLVDEDGFQSVHYGSRNPVQEWLSMRTQFDAMPPRPIHMLDNVSLMAMSHPERLAVWQAWISEMRERIKERLLQVQDLFVAARQELDATRREIDLRALLQSKVIGVTTTGLARITDVLARLNSKVLICEEAGEVLEAHTLITLLPTIEHLILIGDHLQLRPHIQNYNLSAESHSGAQYSFDMSLFERLVRPLTSEGIAKVPFSTLETQRRMHPSIAELVRSTLYPRLQDSESVKDYPEVVGMRKRLFWLDHRHFEAGAEGDQIMATSHSNDYEVDMVVALVYHLVKQGTYRSNEIAVLTPYLGQLRKLRLELGKVFAVTVGDRDLDELAQEGIELEDLEPVPVTSRTSLLKALRIATVDNFQGEEANVVIVSLVRSNAERKAGFLRTSNRINVLCSRAKHGMYIIGNSETAEGVPMFSDILSLLKSNGNFGKHLELSCPRHPSKVMEVKQVDDFAKLSPEGGCNEQCDDRLACGHKCLQGCHAAVMHDAVECLEPCQKPIAGCDEHPCPRACGRTCPPKCKETIKDVVLPGCGHVQDLHCYEAKNLDNAFCKEDVEYQMPGCNHWLSVSCSELKSPDKIKCAATCGTILACGHPCKRLCSRCRVKREDGEVHVDHDECLHVCKRPYITCRHQCTTLCHGEEPCELCKEPCEEKCFHSACKKLCSEPCTPCAEPCQAIACGHNNTSCEMPCAVPCNTVPCSERCTKLLRCGHQCVTLDSEPCPHMKYCQLCSSDDIKNTQVDLVMMEKYKDVDLDTDPVLVPRCGHVITVASLDGHFAMRKHYEMQDGINIYGISTSSTTFSAEQDMKRCPTCRGSLKSIQRYARITRRALLDESTKRFIVWAQKGYLLHEASFSEVEDYFADATVLCAVQGRLELKGTRSQQFRDISKVPVFSRVYLKAIELRRTIERYVKNVAKEEQPYHRVRDMVEDARKRKNLLIEKIPDEIQTVEMRHAIQASALLLRFDLLLVSKLVAVKQSTKKAMTTKVEIVSGPEIKLDCSAHRGDCIKLIDDAADAKLPAQEADAHITFARFAALELSVANHAVDEMDDDLEEGEISEAIDHAVAMAEQLKDDAFEHLSKAQVLCDRYPGQCKGRAAEIDGAEKMLRGHFYTEVTNEERRAVLKAMAGELSGSGHWYTCSSGHPFTIGECGMPMEEARCPQCNSRIGGQDHVAVEGVRHAEELESELAGLTI